jgi:hypothetical protein
VKEEITPDTICLREPDDNDPTSLNTITQPVLDSALRNHTVETWKPEGGPDADLVCTFWSPSVVKR